ncbi:GIY-YIG nuclease family protein [Pueribacillus sp. YX66]|uniref:GIY-YIG nuclease family protein n=1 Tax=Pueribacillus sp. YX66 TaxID=3229242 RepID=UPI00358D6BBF
MNGNYIVYMLQCGDGSLYTGMTNDLEKRLEAHRSGKGAKYTRGRGPFTVVYTETCLSKSDALKAEHRIKSMDRACKLQLIEEGKNV